MEGTVQSIVVDAPPEVVRRVALDVERYPEWAGGVKSVRVLEVDEAGRPAKAEFEVDAMIKELSYTLVYDHEHESGFSWTAIPNEDLEALEGSYEFHETDDGGTEVVYALRVEPAFKVPGFLRRQAEKQIIGTALRGLKKQAEAAAT